jgi:excisionase family DNA binding protein
MSNAQFSSFQIAKMLGVSRQAVNQWIDKGFIASYRTPGGHRRVMLEGLVTFLNARKMPLPEELEGYAVAPSSLAAMAEVAIVDEDRGRAAAVEQALLKLAPKTRLRAFDNLVDGLLAIGARPPQLLLIDLDVAHACGAEAVRRLKANPATRAVRIVAIDADAAQQALHGEGELPVERVLLQGLSPMEIARESLEVLAMRGAHATNETVPIL